MSTNRRRTIIRAPRRNSANAELWAANIAGMLFVLLLAAVICADTYSRTH